MEGMDDVSFGRRLATIRRGKGMTQEALARAAGLSTSAVAKIENAGIDPSWSTVCKIADVLNVSLDDFRDKAADATPDTPAPERRKKR
jgi:transcriptional regulator with XRE-family HTH domain